MDRKKYEKNSWMVGWTGKIDEWLNGEKINYENIVGWLDGQEKQKDVWMDRKKIDG